jgi:hypothetical protein
VRQLIRPPGHRSGTGHAGVPVVGGVAAAEAAELSLIINLSSPSGCRRGYPR